MGSPRVLVTVAGRHGATDQLAVSLGHRLTESVRGRAGGLRADVVPVGEDPDPAGYDAVVLGSAVYLGHWLPAARAWTRTHQAALRERPVWVFSSGPVPDASGDDPTGPVDPGPPEDAVVAAELVGALGNRVLPGRLSRELLHWYERVVVAVVHAPLGDARDWEAVRRWADEVAGAVVERCGPVAGAPR